MAIWTKCGPYKIAHLTPFDMGLVVVVVMLEGDEQTPHEAINGVVVNQRQSTGRSEWLNGS